MRGRLKVLALHSFRTSGSIFKSQVARAGLDQSLGDLLDVVFINSPNPASGPIPKDVEPFFEGPYYEWWNAVKTDEGDVEYEGWETSLAHVTKCLAEQGPFDGIMGFSQGGTVAALLVALQQQGLILQDVPTLRFAVIFAGGMSRLAAHLVAYDKPIRCNAALIMGDRDPLKSYFTPLIDCFQQPVIIRHDRGHVIPALEGDALQRLRTFLQLQTQDSAL